MDGLSGAASDKLRPLWLRYYQDPKCRVFLAVVSLSLQLAEGFAKLYKFWVSIKEAPNHVAVIAEDPLYLSAVLEEISLDQNQTSAMKFGLDCCQGQIMVTQGASHLVVWCYAEMIQAVQLNRGRNRPRFPRGFPKRTLAPPDCGLNSRLHKTKPRFKNSVCHSVILSLRSCWPLCCNCKSESAIGFSWTAKIRRSRVLFSESQER